MTDDWVEYFKRPEHNNLINYFSWQQIMLRKIMRHTPEKGNILEVGLGSGWSSVGLAQIGFCLIGIDRSKSVLEYVKGQQERFGVTFDLVLADACNLPFRENIFATAFSQGLLEHFEENSVIQALKEQGFVAQTVIIDVPSIKNKIDSHFYGDENLLSWKKWKKLIASSGLEVINMYGVSPTKLSFILPLGLSKIWSYRLSYGVGFVATNKRKQSSLISNTLNSMRESLADLSV